MKRFDLTGTQFNQIMALFPLRIETLGRKPLDLRSV
jgi:hypothetical protein